MKLPPIMATIVVSNQDYMYVLPGCIEPDGSWQNGPMLEFRVLIIEMVCEKGRNRRIA